METSYFQAAKLFLVSATGLSKDAMHVYVGLAVFFSWVIALRKPMTSFIPLAIVFAVAIIGEMLDMRDDIGSLGYWRWQASLHDIVNTSFWPVAIWLFARFGLMCNREN